ncbi:Wzy polymerase domain-containing protein [Enterobacter vonholyi]|uniref:PglL family O-oligosaccharyltransferase n=1 Tax=Enterobacter vonholyi TaxID=2797505 RepID=UPI002DBBB3C0|nr:Wzy polymerase domain-containing protein [Enterobacter vonholyi]MEB7625531.1 Wzy polymerase domain-containing protein [Enterobacter vonholyi]
MSTYSRKKSWLKKINVSLFMLFCFYWLFLMHLPWPNNGDYGMNLPMNPLGWCFISLLGMFFWLFNKKKSFHYSPVLWLMLACIVLFTIPAFWSPHTALPNAMPRLAGIWAVFFVYMTLLQHRFKEKEAITIFYIISLSAFIECSLSLVGFYCPNYLPFPLNELAKKYSGYAPGVFQQLNVTASFLATGLFALLYLLADTRRNLHEAIMERLRLLLISTFIIIITATIVLFHSRIGWLGGIIAVCCTSILFFQQRFRLCSTLWRRTLIVALPVIGGLLGVLMLQQGVVDSLLHQSSNNQRWLTLDYTLRMISEHPWRGWGLGMFEPAFQRFMADLPGDNPSREMMQHPHNETLFIWAEGGILALAGGLCLLWSWIVLFRRHKSIWQWASLLITLPILLHTQVEFPLYYSVAHFFAVLLLMAVAEGNTRVVNLRSSLFRIPLIALSLYGIVLSFQLFNASIVLGNFETTRLEAPQSITRLSVPWLMQMRYQRDIALLQLINFNESGDITELERYASSNAQWIKMHMDEDAYNDQINILNFLNRPVEAEKLKSDAHRLMPWDDRFKP